MQFSFFLRITEKTIPNMQKAGVSNSMSDYKKEQIADNVSFGRPRLKNIIPKKLKNQPNKV